MRALFEIQIFECVCVRGERKCEKWGLKWCVESCINYKDRCVNVLLSCLDYNDSNMGTFERINTFFI